MIGYGQRNDSRRVRGENCELIVGNVNSFLVSEEQPLICSISPRLSNNIGYEMFESNQWKTDFDPYGQCQSSPIKTTSNHLK
jgi:hypothetical protein